ncbi:cell envelope integrity TolA C-terminal domain-containing protein [Pantoea dispersa]|uniref:cell envelope integrity TolA C-terminal domain-containing protein n=1 Tax=Pantoea dispersa TaxID=59814 RepID=UPI002859B398|nr:cell envelope integrity TolA C-terminal domain-containing protein [Pantoea dispersa]MDR6297761.1 membrane protein involved in colicin uptake [Pantoea dispersa]
MKKILCTLAMLVLVGCQSHSSSKPPVSDYASTHPVTVQEYLKSVTSALQVRLYDADSFRGKYCDLVINQKDGQLPNSVSSTAGDEGLCKSTVAAAKKAIDDKAYPYKPSDPKQHLQDELPIRFSPH